MYLEEPKRSNIREVQGSSFVAVVLDMILLELLIIVLRGIEGTTLRGRWACSGNASTSMLKASKEDVVREEILARMVMRRIIIMGILVSP